MVEEEEEVGDEPVDVVLPGMELEMIGEEEATATRVVGVVMEVGELESFMFEVTRMDDEEIALADCLVDETAVDITTDDEAADVLTTFTPEEVFNDDEAAVDFATLAPVLTAPLADVVAATPLDAGLQKTAGV
jgi:hypothetical protein